MTPSPDLSDVSKNSEVGIDQPDYYRQLVDAARGASGQTKDQIFEQLNSKWATDGGEHRAEEAAGRRTPSRRPAPHHPPAR